VTFVSNNLTYVSFWPQWAYKLAKTSLLSGKGIALLANGDAFGANLRLAHELSCHAKPLWQTTTFRGALAPELQERAHRHETV
jgi:hypothetical protein